MGGADCREVADSQRQERADSSGQGEPTVEESTDQLLTIIIIVVTTIVVMCSRGYTCK